MSTVLNPLSNPLLFHPTPPPSFDPSSLHLQSHFPHLIRTISNETYQTNNNNNNNNHSTTLQELTLKTEQQHHQDFSLRPDIPSWLATSATTNSSLYSPALEVAHHDHFINHESHNQPPPPPPLAPPQSAHISATALLQKAAQMGSTMSRPSPIHSQMAGRSNGDLVLPSSPVEKGFVNGSTAPSNHFLQMMNSFTQGTGFRESDGRLEEGGNGGGRKLHKFFLF